MNNQTTFGSLIDILTLMDRKYFEFLLGKKSLQYFFGKLYKLSLMGLNYGDGGDFRMDGELYVVKYIQKELKTKYPLVLFDVGANVGHYSVALAEILGENASIYSFEPSQSTYQKLLANITAWPSIKPNNIGLGNEEETLTLYIDKEKSSLASMYNRNLEHIGLELNDTEQIVISTVDLFCERNNISRIHLLKLDIEGNELNALQGADKMINEGKIDFIQFEFGGTNIDSKTYFRDFWYLMKDRYDFYRILKNGLAPIDKYKELNEVFTTTNYLLRLRK